MRRVIPLLLPFGLGLLIGASIKMLWLVLRIVWELGPIAILIAIVFPALLSLALVFVVEYFEKKDPDKETESDVPFRTAFGGGLAMGTAISLVRHLGTEAPA